MESIFPEETPLAAFLEGEGLANDSFHYLEADDHPRPASVTSSSSEPGQSFAPRPPTTNPSRRLNRFKESLRLRIPEKSPVSKAHAAWSRAVNSRLGRAENAQFLEHFRYVVVASQLLNEYPDIGSLHTTELENHTPSLASATSGFQAQDVNLSGGLMTIGVVFVFVLFLNWSRGARISKQRLVFTSACLLLTGILFYTHLRRQWLKRLRQQAVDSVSDLTTNVKAFELTSTAALSLIQEIELVSKGFRLSIPLPPISRMEDVKVNRKCQRLRKCLQRAYATILPAFRQAHASLAPLLKEEDLERFLDVYDIPYHAIQEAVNPPLIDHEEEEEEEDQESLKSLRLLGYQYTTLRRVVLCSLMSLEADGGKPDFARWWSAIETVNSLSLTSATWAQNLNELLRETEQFTMPATPTTTPRLANDRVRAQVRNITNVSSGIRSLQAKMALLREESNKAVEGSDDLTDLGPSLMSQYESIGSDLKMLLQAWETGKASLANNIDKQEKRISRASSVFRSPATSLGGLTAVEEGGPEDALRALTGETSSPRSSLSASDEEIFEGISMPRQRLRSSLTREERIIKMQEERERQVEVRAKRESSTNMIRELQSVMTLRLPKKSGGRITSI